MKISLRTGCFISKPAVSPKNWQTCSPIALKKAWRVTYRFYDQNGASKQKKIEVFKEYPTLEERRDAIRTVVEEIMYAHTVKGYNLITGEYDSASYATPSGVSPKTNVVDALKWALQRLGYSERTQKDYEFKLNHVCDSIYLQNLGSLRISDFTRRYVRSTLEGISAATGRPLTDYMFNAYRKMLSALFKVLLEEEVVETDHTRDIAKRRVITKVRITIPESERKRIREHLTSKHYPFWRFVFIFYHSGRRSSEMLGIKAGDVDLKTQTYKYTLLKGRKPSQKVGVIKDIALPVWREIIALCKKDDYLFSSGFLPGSKKIKELSASWTWKRLIKEDLGMDYTFYSLKHTHADEVAQLYGMNVAQSVMGHSSQRTSRIYAVNEVFRESEILRKLSNDF